jgi:hypothetical protein
VGKKGVGKTRFAIVEAYYKLERFCFKEGIFYIDLKKIKFIDAAKNKITEVLNLCSESSCDVTNFFSDRRVLLILDNVDGLSKHSLPQFVWFLISLLKNSDNLKIMMISKQALKQKKLESISKQIEVVKLEPLNDIEAVDMLLS